VRKHRSGVESEELPTLVEVALRPELPLRRSAASTWAVAGCSKSTAILAMRQEQARPKGQLGKAITYALNQRDRLLVFLEEPMLTPDNNLAENAIRPFVLGRKNWLFAGTPKGAEASATLYSLIETAKANNCEPYSYLRHIFERLPQASVLADYEALLPWNVNRAKNILEGMGGKIRRIRISGTTSLGEGISVTTPWHIFTILTSSYSRRTNLAILFFIILNKLFLSRADELVAFKPICFSMEVAICPRVW
jgi:hypothetical protein